MNILQITCLYKYEKYDNEDIVASLSFPFTIKRGVRAPTGASTKSIFTYLAKRVMESGASSWNEKKRSLLNFI